MDVLGVILAKDNKIFTCALPANSQLMLPNNVFVNFYGALEEGKATIETQMVVRLLCMREASDSIPRIFINYINIHFLFFLIYFVIKKYFIF